jgi:hypothetical protein
MDIQAQIARFRLGLLSGEDLPDVAAAMLQNGFDSQALREVAGLTQPTLRDAGDTFARALSAAGMAQNSRDEDVRLVVSDAVRAIAEGEVTPYAGAAILHAMWLGLDCPELLGEFIYLEDEWSDHPEDREAIEEEIVAAARRLRFALVKGAA